MGHTDAVWDLALHPTTGYILSCSADGSCRLWNHRQTSAQVREFRTEKSEFCGRDISIAGVSTPPPPHYNTT